jgi:hypothetical protein
MRKYTDSKGESVTWFTNSSIENDLKINLLRGIAGPPENSYRQPEDLPYQVGRQNEKPD